MDEVKRKYWASVQDNGDFFHVETRSGFRGGTNADPKGAHDLLPPDANDEALGIALLDALSRSRFVLSSPRPGSKYPPDLEFDKELHDYEQTQARYRQWIADLMQCYGYKTKRALFKNMKNCSVEVDDGVMTIQPWHHEKLEAWDGDGITEADYVVIPANSLPAEIGAALRLAFSRCT